jgi:hypothetical protein
MGYTLISVHKRVIGGKEESQRRSLFDNAWVQLMVAECLEWLCD